MSVLFFGGSVWCGREMQIVLLCCLCADHSIITRAVFLSLKKETGWPPYTYFLSRVHLQGIQFLIENDLLQSSPEDVAQFLYKGEGLNKTVIGDYLGER